MRFTAIRYDGETVGLKWEEKNADAIDKHDWTCDEPPTPAFRAALAAFSTFVVGLIEAPAEWTEGLEIRSIALSEEKKSDARGLVVTALRKCPKAKGRTLLLNSPYMGEPPEGYNGPMDGYLTSAVVELIEAAESQAEAYRNGERGEQTTLELESANTKAVNERMASAEVASTRKPKGKKSPTVTEFNEVTLRQLLLTVDHDVPVSAIERWSIDEQHAAWMWADARLKFLVTGKGAILSESPECVRRDATLPLSAAKHHATAKV